MKENKKDLIDEIHEWRARLLTEHENNFDRYCTFLQEEEKKHLERIVDQIAYVRSEELSSGVKSGPTG
jgi:hypothetical protein